MADKICVLMADCTLLQQCEGLKGENMPPECGEACVTSPDAWMEFVDPSGTPYYYCFLDQTREYEFPKVLPVGQLGVQLMQHGADEGDEHPQGLPFGVHGGFEHVQPLPGVGGVRSRVGMVHAGGAVICGVARQPH